MAAIRKKWTGRESRALREAMRLSQRDFANGLGISAKSISNWESGGADFVPRPESQAILDTKLRLVSAEVRARFELILGANQAEAEPESATATGSDPEEVTSEHSFVAGPQRTTGTERPAVVGGNAIFTANPSVFRIAGVEEEQEEVERRRLLQSLAILGVSASPLSQALETVRTAFGKSVGYDERNHLSYWEEATVEYGYSYLYASPADLVPDLAADLLTVRSIIRRIPDRDSTEYRSWCRVGGALSALMAKSLSNLGHPRNSREWWSMAHHLADASGDRNLALLTRGEHIIHGLYENRPVPVLLRQVKSAAEISTSHPGVGKLALTGARTQVSVLAGDYHSAEEDLHRTQEILERIPSSSATDGTGLVMLWGEAELCYTEAWVYSHMGEEAKTDHAADRAFSLYPASDKRSPIQIKLMQAFARVRHGGIAEGIQHAQSAYEPLALERTTMVDALARGVLNAVPAEEWKRSDVAEYSALVTSRASERRAIEA